MDASRLEEDDTPAGDERAPDGASVEPFPVRLRRLRLERELSLRQVASPGASYAYISRLERGGRTASHKAIRILARRLRVSPDYLETGRTLTTSEELELRLADATLELALEGSAPARQALEELVREAEVTFRPDLLIDARLALAGAAARASDHPAVAALFAELTREPLLVPAAAYPHAYLEYARSRQAIGATSDASRILDEALAQLDSGLDHPPARAQLAAARAALAERGGSETSLEHHGSQAAPGPSRDESVTLARALARHALQQGQDHAALRHFRKALALLTT